MGVSVFFLNFEIEKKNEFQPPSKIQIKLIILMVKKELLNLKAKKK